MIEIEQSKITKTAQFGSIYYEYIFATQKHTYPKNDIKFIKGKQASFDSCESDPKPYLTIDALCSGDISQTATSGIKCSKNDLLMVMDGASSGKIFLGNEGYVGSTLSKIICSKIDSSILYFGLKKFQNELMNHTTGSAIPHADKQYVGELPIADVNSQAQLTSFKLIVSLLSDCQKRIVFLKQLKKSLLMKYFL